MTKIKKIIQFHPSYDKRDPDPSKNYGIHGVFVQFLVYTNWMPKSCRTPWDKEVKALLLQPMPADLGYHSKIPRYKAVWKELAKYYKQVFK